MTDHDEHARATSHTGVHADHAATSAGEEAFVLGQAPTGFVGAMAIGNPVGAGDPDPDSGTGLGHQGQRSLDHLR